MSEAQLVKLAQTFNHHLDAVSDLLCPTETDTPFFINIACVDYQLLFVAEGYLHTDSAEECYVCAQQVPSLRVLKFETTAEWIEKQLEAIKKYASDHGITEQQIENWGCNDAH